MIKRAIITAAVVIAVSAGSAFAVAITVPLPGLEGQVAENPGLVSAIVNAGTSFISIQNVRIVCNGNMSAGISSIVVNYREMIMESEEFFGEAKLSMSTGFGTLYAYLQKDDFGEEMSFSYYTGRRGNWDFLLDGQAEITARMYGSDAPGTILMRSRATITDAYLIIEGTPVPEPMTILLVGLGGLMLRKRR